MSSLDIPQSLGKEDLKIRTSKQYWLAEQTYAFNTYASQNETEVVNVRRLALGITERIQQALGFQLLARNLGKVYPIRKTKLSCLQSQ